MKSLNIIISLCMLLIANSLLAQNNIPIDGEVTIQNSRYRTKKTQYVIGAEVKAISEAYAKPQLTDNAGQFKLIFGDVDQGEEVFLSVTYPDLRVVNENALKNLSVGQKAKVKVYMCDKAVQDLEKMAYHKINKKAITKKYDQQITLLQSNQKNQQRTIQRLEQEFETEYRTKNAALQALSQKQLELTQKERQLTATIQELQKQQIATAAQTVALKDYEQNRQLLQNQTKTLAEKTVEVTEVRLEIELYKEKMIELQATTSQQEKSIDSLAQKLALAKDKDLIIDKLQKQRAIALKQAEEIAAKFAQVNLDDQSAIYIKAFELYQQGQVATAIAILDSIDFEYRLKTNAAEIAKREKQMKQDINALVLNARMKITELKFKEAEKDYDLAIQYAKDNYDIIFEFALFLGKQNNFNKAIILYQNCLELTTSAAQKADILNNLANLKQTKNELNNAESNYLEALKIRRQLAKKNPDAFLPDVATTLNNLAVLQKNRNQLKKAETHYDEALKIYRKLAQKNPQAYTGTLALAINNLGLLYTIKTEFKKAENYHNEALKTYQKLAKKNPDAYILYVANTFGNLGFLYATKNELNKAEIHYQKSLKIHQKLAKKNPDTYEVHVATTLNNLGLVYATKTELKKAETHYNEALNTRRQLAKKNPDAYEVDVAMTLNNLGLLYVTKIELKKAETHYNEALNIYQKLAKKNPDAYDLAVARSNINIGILFYEKYKRNTTKKELKTKGLTLLQNAETYLTKYSNIPTVQKYMRLIERCKNAFENPNVLSDKQKQFIEQTFQVITYYQARADSLFKIQAYTQVLQEYKKSLIKATLVDSLAQNDKTVAHHLSKNNFPPSALRAKYAQNCGNTSWYALFAQEYATAQQYAQKGLALDASQEWIKTNLAHALLFQKKYKEAEAIYLALKNSSHKLSEEKTNVQVLLQDFKDLEAAGVIPKESQEDVEKIRALLEEE